MVGGLLIAAGAVLMLIGVVMMSLAAGGRSRGFDPGGSNRSEQTRIDWVFLDLGFIAKVVLPLLAGAVMIVIGLRMCFA